MRAMPEVYLGEAEGWAYRIFKNSAGKWIAFRWDPAKPQYVSQEWFAEPGFVKDRTMKANDSRLARFDTPEECEQDLLMMFAAAKMSS